MTVSKRQGRIRIAGGSLRGRMLSVPRGVRPTSSRARETLFNWLAGEVVGARCLDLFAGAGALGLEALSRGATECVFVDSGRAPVRALRGVLSEWGAQGTVELADAEQWLERREKSVNLPANIVFLDPPFGTSLAERCCKLLAVNGWLAENCRVYLETHRRDSVPQLPWGLETINETVVGDARMMLVTWSTK